MAFDPAWLSGVGSLLGATGGFFGGGGSEGLSRGDQRFLADFQWKQSLRNEKFQNDLATHGIRMRVADAEAAGLHPLVAAGVNPNGGSFATQITGSPEYREGFGPKLERMGQNISRAASVMMSREEKQAQLLALERTAAETDLVRKQALEVQTRIDLLKNKDTAEPQVIKVRGEDGKIFTVPNPALAVADPLGHITRVGANSGRAAWGSMQRAFKSVVDFYKNRPFWQNKWMYQQGPRHQRRNQ